jgi:hypothetical protein
LFDDSSDNVSVECGSASAESDIDYAQDEFEPAGEEEDNTEPVTVTARDSDAHWVWHDTNAGYRGQKIPFSGQHGPQNILIMLKTHFYCFLTKK